MLIALISDMHGNGLALEKVVEDLRRRAPDATICLGDAFQGGVDPVRVAELLDEIGCTTVLGNSDSWLVTGESAEQVNERAFEIREWTKDQLGQQGLEMIQSFPMTHTAELEDGRTLLCFHGTPTSFDALVFPESTEAELEEALGDTDAALLAGGHTHISWTRSMSRYSYVNPGSCGVTYNRYMEQEEFFMYPVANYALVHSTKDGFGIEFCSIPFDREEMISRTIASGRPHAESDRRLYTPPG